MYIEMNPTGLTLSDLICVAHRKRSEDTGFPYAVQSCRCSNCRYVSETNMPAMRLRTPKGARQEMLPMVQVRSGIGD